MAQTKRLRKNTKRFASFRANITQITATENMIGDLIKSRQRVKEFAEVYTAFEQINTMLDELDTSEAGHVISNIDSKILEPACGNGNYLDEILVRKLYTINAESKTKADIKLNTVIAISSLYGVDIQKDNTVECKARLANTVGSFLSSKDIKPPAAINHILSKNIIHGNTLTATKGSGKAALVMTEWDFDSKGNVSSKNFKYSDLTQDSPKPISNKKAVKINQLGAK